MDDIRFVVHNSSFAPCSTSTTDHLVSHLRVDSTQSASCPRRICTAALFALSSTSPFAPTSLTMSQSVSLSSLSIQDDDDEKKELSTPGPLSAHDNAPSSSLPSTSAPPIAVLTEEQRFNWDALLTPYNAFRTVVNCTPPRELIHPKHDWAFQVTGLTNMIMAVLMSLQRTDNFNATLSRIDKRGQKLSGLKAFFDKRIAFVATDTRQRPVRDALIHPADWERIAQWQRGPSNQFKFLGSKLRNAFAHANWEFELLLEGGGSTGYEWIIVRDEDGFEARFHVVPLIETLERVLLQYAFLLSSNQYAALVRRHGHLQRSFTLGDPYCFIDEEKLEKMRQEVERDTGQVIEDMRGVRKRSKRRGKT